MTVTTTVTTTPTSHQRCPSQSTRPGTSYHHLMLSYKRNWRFCMNHSYIIKLHWFLGQPLNPHLITCDYLQKNPEYLSSLPWRSCHVLTRSPAAVRSAGKPQIWWQFHACLDCCTDVLHRYRLNSQHVSTFAESDSAVFMDRLLYLVYIFNRGHTTSQLWKPLKNYITLIFCIPKADF